MNGSSNGRTAYVVNGKGHVVQAESASVQIVGLQSVATVFHLLANKAFNLYTDSQYIFNALQVLETIPHIGTSNKQVNMLFQKIQNAI